MTNRQWMPLMGNSHGLAIRMDLLNEQQAQRNHGQTLDRLAERGGLSPCEAMAIAEQRKWRNMRGPDAIEALTGLAQRTAPVPACLMCGGHGLVGGHAADGSHDDQPSPDCNTPDPTRALLQEALTAWDQ